MENSFIIYLCRSKTIWLDFTYWATAAIKSHSDMCILQLGSSVRVAQGLTSNNGIIICAALATATKMNIAMPVSKKFELFCSTYGQDYFFPFIYVRVDHLFLIQSVVFFFSSQICCIVWFPKTLNKAKESYGLLLWCFFLSFFGA